MSGGATDDQSPMGGGPQPTPPTMPTPPMTGMPRPQPMPGPWFGGGPDEDMRGGMPGFGAPGLPGLRGGFDEDIGQGGGMPNPPWGGLGAGPTPTPWGGGGARAPMPMPMPGWLSNGPAGLNPGGNPLDTLRGMFGGGGGARPPVPTPRPFGGGGMDEDRIPGAMGSLGRLAAQPPRRPSSGSPPPTPRSRGPNRGRGNPGGY